MDVIDKKHFGYVKDFIQLTEKSTKRNAVIWYLEHFDFTEEQLEELAPFFNDDEWRKVSSIQRPLSNTFIREHADKLHWMIISFHYVFDTDFLREMANYIDWRPVCTHYNVDSKFVREFYDYINWHFIAKFQYFDMDFVKMWRMELKDCIDGIIENNKLDGRNGDYVYELVDYAEYIKETNQK